MKDTYLVIKNNELFIGTWKLCHEFEIEHKSLKRLIDDFRKDFEELGDSPISYTVSSKSLEQYSRFKNDENTTKKRGRPPIEYLLTEPQATYLITLVRNSEKVRRFKLHLTKEFFRQRKILMSVALEKKNKEWIEMRESGKLERRFETDTIQKFVEYATLQGSKNSKKYYMVISKMENHTLFALDFLEQKFENLRENLSVRGLDLLRTADQIVAKALREGMEQLLFYKDIYIMAKERVENFSVLIGKTPLQNVLMIKNNEFQT